jgi:subtilisin family serine protease
MPGSAWAIHQAVPAVHGDVSRALLGDGTGVIIGMVDSGVDKLHPAFAGNDSQGNPRLVAEHNYVPVSLPNEPAGNTGDDRHGHGTFIAGPALSSHPTYLGMAPDARYVNSRVLDYNANYSGDAIIRSGVGFAINQGADVVNLALNFNATNNPIPNGSSPLDLMIDWAARELGVSCVICAGNISQATDGSTQVRAPASAYNGITVGHTVVDTTRVHTNAATAFTNDGRMKPDLVAPRTGFVVPRHDWEGATPDWLDLPDASNGCSLAVPMVGGMIAQQIEGGRLHGLSTDPLVVKATLMNSAAKVRDKNNNAWQPHTASLANEVFTTTRPLDDHSGAGQIDGAALAEQYLAGEFAPGLVSPVGWDLHSVGAGQFLDYAIGPQLLTGSMLTTTLTWHRHVGRTDNGNGIVDVGDSFFLIRALTNLDLQIFRNGELFAQSMSPVDNVEHLNLLLDTTANYTLRVLNIGSFAEQFALAWHGVGVPAPEPATWVLAISAALTMGRRRRRRFRADR